MTQASNRLFNREEGLSSPAWRTPAVRGQAEKRAVEWPSSAHGREKSSLCSLPVHLCKLVGLAVSIALFFKEMQWSSKQGQKTCLCTLANRFMLGGSLQVPTPKVSLYFQLCFLGSCSTCTSSRSPLGTALSRGLPFFPSVSFVGSD